VEPAGIGERRAAMTMTDATASAASIARASAGRRPGPSGVVRRINEIG
jgi:hypothetical protein